MLDDVMKRFQPDRETLFRRVSAHTSDEALERISTADYGIDADLHLAALNHLRETGTFRKTMHSYPCEVLELIRWSVPEDPEWTPGESGELGHWMRAFSCAALLRATGQPLNYGRGIGTDSTVVHLILSLDELPTDLTLDAARSLAWLLLDARPGELEEGCAYGVGLLWCALKHPAYFADADLVALADWIFRQADEAYEGTASEEDGSLRRLSASSGTWASWEKLGVKFLDLDLTGRSDDLQLRAWAIGSGLLNQWHRNKWKTGRRLSS